MRIAIIGASGNVGTRLVDEALRRGHEVTAISRHGHVTQRRERLSSLTGDVAAPAQLALTLKGHDAVASSVGFRQASADQFVAVMRRSGVKRYLAVGGAGSLRTEPATLLLDSPQFPAEYRDEALAGKAFLDVLRQVRDLDWTVLSPSALFAPGQRTGTFRLGLDTLLTDREGKSWISYEDFAIALFDEIEHPRHIRQRFTIGY